MKSTSTCELLVLLWADHPGQPTTAPKEEGKKKKKGGGKTVSSVYLVSLVDLMTTLYSCEPHFVRCLVPNNHKKTGDVEPPLIMHQLTCNGVLEGIRICMRGFPNRMQYPDFKLRYSCLGQEAIASSSDNKTAVWALMDGIPFDRERYRLGHTMVFFRAGALGGLEEERDKLVIKWVRMIQGEVLKRIRGAVYKKKFDQRELIKVGQRNFGKYLASRDWGWFVLIQKTRGLIGLPNPEEELRELEEKANAKYGAYKDALDVTKELEGSMDGLKSDIDAMGKQLAEEQGNISVYTDRQAKAVAQKAATEAELKTQQAVLSQEESSRIVLAAEVKAHSGSIGVVKKEIEDIELAISKVELEKGNRDHTIKVLQDEIAEQDEVINKLNKEKKHAIAGNAETQTTIKKYALQVRDAQLKVDEESASKSAAADAKVAADRKAAAMANGLEEARALLETADRQRRSAEQELADTNESLADLNNVSQSITAAKRKLEGELNQLNADLDEMTNEARLSEDKAARAMVDAARLADELRCEQDLAMNLEKDKKLLEAQCKDAGQRADEAEVNALKGGRKAMIKMETRIRELESELDAESRRNGDICKNLRKSERTIKELTFAGDEDKKNHERMQALIDQLQGKVKSYKKQIEEAEEIAALNLAKYRKVAGALGDAAAEADANEQAAAMRKARARSASLV